VNSLPVCSQMLCLRTGLCAAVNYMAATPVVGLGSTELYCPSVSDCRGHSINSMALSAMLTTHVPLTLVGRVE
jgi:hypothetical protein